MVEQERQKIRHLLVVKDRRGKRAVPLTLDTYSLGRSPDNSIVLCSSSVSRQHAVIYPINDSDNKLAPFQIIDGNLQGIKSTNGLLINGIKCQSHNLQHGDVIEFGNSVKVTYYTLFNLSDREFTQFCEVQNNAEVIQDSIVRSEFTTYTHHQTELTNIDRSQLIRLASFAESILYPIIEIDLLGSVIYANPTAIQQFPQLQTLDSNHPIIKDLPATIKGKTVDNFIREIQFDNRYLEQSIQYLEQEQVIRVFTLDITPYREEMIIKNYSDRILKEVITESNLRFESKIQSLLKIGCDCFNLDLGFLGKLQNKSLKIATIYQKQENDPILDKNQLLEISSQSSQKIFRLFQFTLDSKKPVTLQDFEREDLNSLPNDNQFSGTEFIFLKTYLGIPLFVGKKLYGMLAFYGYTHQIDQFSPAKINFLIMMAQCLKREIERQKMELVLKKIIKQKKYYQQITEDINNPIDEVRSLALQLLTAIDSQRDYLKENNQDTNDNLLYSVEYLWDI